VAYVSILRWLWRWQRTEHKWSEIQDEFRLILFFEAWAQMEDCGPNFRMCGLNCARVRASCVRLYQQ
jgi:hypothetical protein